MYADESSERLWSRFVEGDVGAFETLFQLYSDKLYKYGMSIIRDKPLVDECISSLFQYLFEKRSSLTQPDNVMAYLVSCLRHQLYRRIRTEYICRLNIAEVPEIFCAEEDLPSWNDLQELKDLELKALSSALDVLSTQQKEVIYLKYYIGLNVREISKLLGISHRTVYNVTFTALSQMRSNKNVKEALTEHLL